MADTGVTVKLSEDEVRGVDELCTAYAGPMGPPRRAEVAHLAIGAGILVVRERAALGGLLGLGEQERARGEREMRVGSRGGVGEGGVGEGGVGAARTPRGLRAAQDPEAVERRRLATNLRNRQRRCPHLGVVETSPPSCERCGKVMGGET